MSEETTWRGVPLSEIYGSESPWGAPEFPLVKPSYEHAVLYHIPASGSLSADRPPVPQIGTDKWDHDHVRLPCSTHSLYPVIDDTTGETYLKQRWEIIQAALSKPIRNSKELADAIFSYNTKFKDIWKFTALHKLFNKYLEEEETKYFFEVTLPLIAKLALSLPNLIRAPIPLLKKGKNRSVSLSQQQVSSLLANAFFCTFPRRNTEKPNSEYYTYPRFNFSRLYNSPGMVHVMEKIKCICHYFRRVCTKGAGAGVLTVSRRCVPARSAPCWASEPAPLAELPLHIDSDVLIEDMHGLIQVDFANKYLGGGVLGQGCVQEEIRFVISPELMVSMLVTEELDPNEALIIIGSERYSEYVGYSSKFRWAGDYRDACPHDSSQRRRCAVLALDALPRRRERHQYGQEPIDRELNKAWVGFTWGCGAEGAEGASLNYPGVATGNWGCGAFGGTPRLKALQQVMASSVARRPLAYCTFGDAALRDDLAHMYNTLARHRITVGQLHGYLMKFSETDVEKNDLYPFLLQTLIEEEQRRADASGGSRAREVARSTTAPAQVHGPSPLSADESERDECELPESIQKAFLSESPDLFSQEEGDVSMTEVSTNMDQKQTHIIEIHSSDSLSEPAGETNHSVTNHHHQVIKAGEQDVTMSDDPPFKQTENNTLSKMVTEVKKAKQEVFNTSDHTSRLFDEIEKLEQGSGGRTSEKRRRSDVKGIIDQEGSTGCGPVHQRGLSVEDKKKLSKKITDYFSKKSI